jgi:succinate dehydrogenase / fumarate reductase flavoprotein subunit
MQGLADGYFVLPYTIGGYLAGTAKADVTTGHKAFDESEKQVTGRIERLLSVNGKRTVDDFHKTLGRIMWEYCGMARNNEGLEMARGMIQELRAEFWENVRVPGTAADFNQSLERAGRVADFLEFGELMIIDALARQESCGGHFNENLKPRSTKPSGMMIISVMRRHGNTRGTVRNRNSTKNPWYLKTSNLRKGATSDKDD